MANSEGLKYDLGPWFVETKLSPPSVFFTQLIERTAVVEELASLDRHKVCLLAAPAGYGKTCLLVDWRRLELERKNHVAWVSLEESDSEIRQFLSYVVLSIASTDVSLGGIEFAAQQGLVEVSPESILKRLVHELTQLETPLTLILDDYHRASSEETDYVVNYLISQGPKFLRIIISCRHLPNLDTSTYLASGVAFKFPAENLKLTLEETHEVIGDSLDIAAKNEIFNQTEGWAVAIQLARLAKESEVDGITLPASTDEQIINYFTRQILDQSTDEERLFLLQTSILDRFTPALATALTENDSVNSIMHDSTHIRSLLISLDSRGGWYRYHHLLSEILYQQLRISHQDQLPALHKRASIWFERKGYILDAVKHAKAAGDSEEAARLVLDAGGWELVLYAGIASIHSLLRNFDRRDFDCFPRLRVAYAYSLIKDGKIQDAEAQLALVETTSDNELFHRDYYIIRILLSTYKDELIDPEIVAEMERRVSYWSASDVLGIGVLEATLAISKMIRGDFDAAEKHAAGSIKSMRQADSVLGVNYSYIHLGQCAFYRGDFELARAHLSEASSMAEDNFGADSRLKTNCDINLSALKFWRRPDSFDFEFHKESLRRACETDSWGEIYIAGFTALFEHLRTNKSQRETHESLQMFQATRLARDIARLGKLGSAYGLQCALTCGSLKESALAIEACHEVISSIESSSGNEFWVVKLETIYVLGVAASEGNKVEGIIKLLDSAIRLSESLDSNFFLVRLLVLRGALAGEKKGASGGLDDVFKAARIGARSSIRQPFCSTNLVSKYMRSVIRIGRELPEYRLEVSFLTECLAISSIRSNQARTKLLSAREHDVLEELALGRSNKEIARALDMTDHTVKFHLKNIFRKFGVDNRIAAINAGRELELI